MYGVGNREEENPNFFVGIKRLLSVDYFYSMPNTFHV